MSIKLVLFDIGGVINLGDFYGYYDHIAKLSMRDVEEVKEEIRPLYKKMAVAALGLDEFNTILEQRLGIDRDKIDWTSYFERNLAVDARMIDLINELKKSYIVGCLSNDEEERHRIFFNHVGDGLFSHKFLSWKIGSRKPDKEIYEHVLRSVPFKPSEILFIDDKLKNVEVAREVGIRAIHYMGREHDFDGFKVELQRALSQKGRIST